MQIIKRLDRFLEENLMVFLLILINVVMLTQIIARYCFQQTLPWPEEFCRYCYVWTVFLSLGYTIRNGNALRVTVLMDFLPAVMKNTIRIMGDLVTLVLFCVFFINSIGMVGNVRASNQTSSAMGLPMWIVYLCVVAGFGLAIVRMIQAILYSLRHFRDQGDSALEATMKEAQAEAELARQDTLALEKHQSKRGEL